MKKIFREYSISDAPTFLMRRMIRIEPPYIISIIIVIGLWHLSFLTPGFAGSRPEYSFLQILAHFLYLAPLTGHNWLQPVYWSLAYEFAYYIFMALFLPSLIRCSAIYWGGLIILYVVIFVSFVPTRCFLFIMGFVVFKHKSANGGWFETGVVLATATLSMSFLGAPIQGLVGAATAILILVCFGLEFRGLLRRLVVYLSSLSYSLYLVHVPIGGRVVNFGRRIVDTALEAMFISFCALIISLCAAWILWYLVELPALKLARAYPFSSRKLNDSDKI